VEQGRETGPSSGDGPLLTSAIDSVLTAQLAVAWAGEKGEEPRLGWWRSDLASEFGGEDLFRRLLPHTWRWAVLQGAREAAIRRDRELRAQDHDADRIVSLFRFGFEVDERIEERLGQLKGSGREPVAALPGLRDVITDTWHRERFADWVDGHGRAELTTVPIGRRLKGAEPGDLETLVARLVSALHPLSPHYPLPHFRRER